jgi:microcystin degradation protein MlrC
MVSSGAKVAVLGFIHETNTFVQPEPTGALSFRSSPPARGSVGRLVSGIADVVGDGCWLGGWVSAPTGSGRLPSGSADRIAEYLIDPLGRRRPDAVVCCLHGASVSDDHESTELPVLRHLRQALGQDVPVVVTNDPHGNISAEWASLAGAIIANRTTPHRDHTSTGRRAGAFVLRMLETPQPPPLVTKVPILLKGTLTSYTRPLVRPRPPFALFQRAARAAERRYQVADISINAGQGSCDVASAGLSIVGNGYAAADSAGRAAAELADLIWTHRAELDARSSMVPVKEALRTAVLRSGTSYLIDEGTDLSAGGRGDRSEVVRGLRDAAWPAAAVAVTDADLVAEAQSAKSAGAVTLRLGSMRLDGWLEQIGENCVVLRTGASHIVVSRTPLILRTPLPYQRFGIDLSTKKIVVLGAVARAGMTSRLGPGDVIVSLDTAGVGNPDPRRYAYASVGRPVFPLDYQTWPGDAPPTST